MTESERQIRPIDILLVEDSPADVRLTREALKEARVLNTLHVVQDGMAALAFLRREGQYTTRQRAGTGVAGPEPAQDGWPRGAGQDQAD